MLVNMEIEIFYLWLTLILFVINISFKNNNVNSMLGME